MRERMLVGLLALAAGLIVAGVARYATGVALIVAGILLAGIAWLFLAEVGE